MKRENTEFDVTGINHLALVCRDMERTVDFYTNVLGFPLIKTLELPMEMGQHFFFDIGNGDSLAFCARRDATRGRHRQRHWFHEPRGVQRAR